MNKTQQAFRKYRFLFVIGGIAVSSVWGIHIVKGLLENHQKKAEAAASTVTVHPASPVAKMPAAKFSSTKRSTRAPQASYGTSNQTQTQLPQATMTSTSMRLHETNNATPQYVSMGTQTESFGLGKSHRAKVKETSSAMLAYGGMIYVSTPHNAVTEVGATNAAGSVMGPGPKPRRGGEPPLPDVPFPTPVPVGDVAWLLMALLAAAYAGFCYGRKKVRG